MAGEKYIIATTENSLRVAVRNILNPNGYIYLESTNQAASLIRAVRTFHPDFAIVDLESAQSDVRRSLETIDSEMLCPCILIGSYKDSAVLSIIESSYSVSFCPKQVIREALLNTVEMAIINYRRILGYDKKIKQITEDYEGKRFVDRAKCILMERNKISEKEAYDIIRKASMNSRKSMRATAQSIIFDENA